MKIVHLIRKYMALFGKETEDSNHKTSFVFKGDRTTRCDPPIVYLTTGMLQKFKARVKTEQEIQEHYAQDVALAIVLINDTEGNRDTIHMVMVPLNKWAAELIDKNATPRQFLELIAQKTIGWDPNDGEYQDYLENWGMTACMTTNNIISKSTSQLSSPLLDIYISNDALEVWAEA